MVPRAWEAFRCPVVRGHPSQSSLRIEVQSGVPCRLRRRSPRQGARVLGAQSWGRVCALGLWPERRCPSSRKVVMNAGQYPVSGAQEAVRRRTRHPPRVSRCLGPPRTPHSGLPGLTPDKQLWASVAFSRECYVWSLAQGASNRHAEQGAVGRGWKPEHCRPRAPLETSTSLWDLTQRRSTQLSQPRGTQPPQGTGHWARRIPGEGSAHLV